LLAGREHGRTIPLADSVLSTPPTNTPIDTNRRHFLSVAAGGAVAAAIPAAALADAPAIDAIFDLIEAHRRAHVAHLESLALQTQLERKHGNGRCRWVSEKPCFDEDDAFETLVSAPATTLPGLIAWLDYLQKLGSEFETEWMMTDRTCAAVLVDRFVTSLKNIGVQS
jgi:hypothetical protein